MSRTEVYAVAPEGGNIELMGEIQNSYRGAMHVWTTLAVNYGLIRRGEEGYLLIRPELMKQLWRFGSDERLAWWERVVLLSTFDRVVILRDDFPRLIEAFSQWTRHTGGDSSIPIQCDLFRRIAQDERPFRGICFNQTSVCENPWWVGGSCEDEEGRPFNIDRDEDWWSLFDQYPHLRAEPVTAV